MTANDQDVGALKVAVNTRRGYKGWITNLLKQDESTIGQVEVKLREIKKYLAKVEDVELEITALASKLYGEEDIDKEFEARNEFQSDILKSIILLESQIMQHQDEPHKAKHAKGSPMVAQVPLNLPQLKLQTFSGDILEWESFWDCYKSSIHQNNALHDVNKFAHLRSCLEGDAAETIKGLRLTDGNYAIAINLLKNQYGKKYVLKKTYMDNLTNLPHINTTGHSLRQFLNHVTLHTRLLENVGVYPNDYGMMLAPMMLNKLPQSLKMEIFRDANSCDLSFEQLLSTLNKVTSIREMCEEMSKRDDQPQQPQCKKISNVSKPVHSHSTTLTINTPPKNKHIHCIFCDSDGEHWSDKCKQHNLDQRHSFVKQHGLCYMCLQKGHVSAKCVSNKKCFYCKAKHHSALCKENETDQVSPLIESQNSHVLASIDCGVIMLETAQVIAHNPCKHNKCNVNVMFDLGSQQSYITEDLMHKLDLHVHASKNMHIYGFGQTAPQVKHMNEVVLNLQSRNDDDMISPLKALVTDHITNPISSVCVQSISKCKHLKGLQLADDFDDHLPKRIHILIGADQYYNFHDGSIKKGDDGPTASNTIFGWTLCGQFKDGVPGNLVNGTQALLSTCLELDQSIEALWKLETLGVITGEQAVHDVFLDSITFKDGRYIVDLPLKDNINLLPDNFVLANKRFMALEKRLVKDDHLNTEYNNIIDNQLECGIVKHVEKSTPVTQTHYIPHKPVVKQHSLTTKVRVVFDASAKSSQTALSLNQCLYGGPCLLPKLFSLLIKFRAYPVAVVADIQQAFLQICVQKEHQRFLRFLWNAEPQDKVGRICELQFTRVMFGLTCSPYLLNATMQLHFDKHMHENPLLMKRIKSSFYVDDLICGGESATEVQELASLTVDVLGKASMKLHKWSTNNTGLKHDLSQSLAMNPNSQIKVLGIPWDTGTDRIMLDHKNFTGISDQTYITKRLVVSIVASVYDPLGFVAPVVVVAKVLIQTLHKMKLGWDEIIPDNLQKDFLSFCRELNNLQEWHIPRCYYQGGVSVHHTELHGFCDSSQHAFAAIVYIKILYCDGSVDVQFVACKTHVAPIKVVTIPRLELLGCLLLSRLHKSVSSNFPPQNSFLWSDSLTALSWIRFSKDWCIFVANRVEEIHGNCDGAQWFHCPGKLNPADLPSRGVSVRQIMDSDLYHKGPNFLRSWSQDSWPDQPETMHLTPSVLEAVKKCSLIVHSCEPELLFPDLEKFSSLDRMLRIVCYVLRFANFKTIKFDSIIVTAVERKAAHTLMIRIIQKTELRDLFEALTKGRQVPKEVVALNPFIDAHSIIRVRGRLDYADFKVNNTPILLPSNNHFTRLIVLKAHRIVCHQGINDTLAQVREQYWIVRGRQVVKKLIRPCITCKKLQGQPYNLPTMAPLPQARLSQGECFSIVGLDFAGPLQVKGSTKGTTKPIYICIFTCANVRAVHFEVVPTLSTADFLWH